MEELLEYKQQEKISISAVRWNKASNPNPTTNKEKLRRFVTMNDGRQKDSRLNYSLETDRTGAPDSWKNHNNSSSRDDLRLVQLQEDRSIGFSDKQNSRTNNPEAKSAKLQKNRYKVGYTTAGRPLPKALGYPSQ